MTLQLKTPQPSRHPDPTTQAKKLAYVIFERTDLYKAETFLADFGLSVALYTGDTLYMRGNDDTPVCYIVRKATESRFVGLGLQVGSKEDLRKLALLPGASRPFDAPYPGGGSLVRLVDPAGFCVEAITGQIPAPRMALQDPIAHNSPDRSPRVNTTQRIVPLPPAVTKLGHTVMEVPNFQETCGWYTQHFGFIPSDVQLLPDGSPGVAFMRLNLGDTPTDHHTLGLVQGIVPAFNHCSFEVTDMDAIAMGQRILRERHHDHVWGMGRHIFGSQIFDYWRDPWRDKHEHYCDGDQFTATMPMGVHAISAASMAQWGPPMPKDFTHPTFNLNLVTGIVQHLRHTPDLTLGKLRLLARMFS